MLADDAILLESGMLWLKVVATIDRSGVQVGAFQAVGWSGGSKSKVGNNKKACGSLGDVARVINDDDDAEQAKTE